MKRTFSVAALPLLAAALVPLVTGCETVEKYSLTHRLWNDSDWRQFCEPAPNPNLALFEPVDRADVLVQYDALSEKHSTVKRQAYYLLSNQARIEAGAKPELVDPSVADGMQPIPVLLPQGSNTNQPRELPPYAVVAKAGRGFILYRTTEAESAFDLPVYAEASGTLTRIALTPFALTGDTVMVGAVCGFVGFCLWLEGGAPTH